MMIDTAALDAAKAYEEKRIVGYKIILSYPSDVLDDEGRFEINEALTWSTERLNLIDESIIAIQLLVGNGYPGREQQRASQRVIDMFKNNLEAIDAAIDEFIEPVVFSVDTVIK